MYITMKEIKHVAKHIDLDMNLVAFIVWIVSVSVGAYRQFPNGNIVNFNNIQKFFNE